MTQLKLFLIIFNILELKDTTIIIIIYKRKFLNLNINKIYFSQL